VDGMIKINDSIIKLVNAEIKKSINQYGHSETIYDYMRLVNKECQEALDGTLKANSGIDLYRVWAISHNLIQTIAACVKYLDLFEKMGIDYNKYDMDFSRFISKTNRLKF
jgi:hypothetical protein